MQPLLAETHPPADLVALSVECIRDKVAATLASDDRSRWCSHSGVNEAEVPRMPVGERFWAEFVSAATIGHDNLAGLLADEAAPACGPVLALSPVGVGTIG